MKFQIKTLSDIRTKSNKLRGGLSIHLLLVAAIFQLLTACDMESPAAKGANQAVTPASINSSNLESFVKIDVKAADPEKYIVHFSWPIIEDGKIIRVRLDKVMAEVLPSQTFFTHQVSHDQRLKYYVDILDQSKSVQKTFSREIIVPTDFVVRENHNTFSGHTELYINRLYLDASLPLQTNGNDVSIFANEIHSPNGTIRTFPDGSKTPATEGVQDSDSGKAIIRAPSGRDGGNLTIKTSKMIGEMRIELRGENGADGKDGVHNPNRAADGTPGSQGEQRCREHNGYQDCECHRDGSNGGNGTDGSKGENGWYGGNGGGTGTAQVFIRSYTPAVSADPTYPNEKREPVTIVKVPGAPGKKGVGAAGQSGGKRGEVPSSPYQCPGQPGNPGKTGEQGDDGQNGNPGPVEESCIYVGSENINDCR